MNQALSLAMFHTLGDLAGESPNPPPAVWLLATGSWDDAGVWDDSAAWID